MKRPLASAHLAPHLNHPLRFGRVWRGHELLLRVVQVALLFVVAVFGAKMIAHGVALASRALAGLFS